MVLRQCGPLLLLHVLVARIMIKYVKETIFPHLRILLWRIQHRMEPWCTSDEPWMLKQKINLWRVLEASRGLGLQQPTICFIMLTFNLQEWYSTWQARNTWSQTIFVTCTCVVPILIIRSQFFEFGQFHNIHPIRNLHFARPKMKRSQLTCVALALSFLLYNAQMSTLHSIQYVHFLLSSGHVNWHDTINDSGGSSLQWCIQTAKECVNSPKISVTFCETNSLFIITMHLNPETNTPWLTGHYNQMYIMWRARPTLP